MPDCKCRVRDAQLGNVVHSGYVHAASQPYDMTTLRRGERASVTVPQPLDSGTLVLSGIARLWSQPKPRNRSLSFALRYPDKPPLARRPSIYEADLAAGRARSEAWQQYFQAKLRQPHQRRSKLERDTQHPTARTAGWNAAGNSLNPLGPPPSSLALSPKPSPPSDRSRQPGKTSLASTRILARCDWSAVYVWH
ncbi:hypothetical protein CC78DRAFT_575119 [Lojkania enalia]|uniref:Uncharacterized protein n=1 Tax=Lojkania enalia TaxID=147567 RepID=A0A9P4NAD7_9PLEO|nr:hypothetical protein CC78DRAFT_575119 [Didymosphaeria enalia]